MRVGSSVWHSRRIDVPNSEKDIFEEPFEIKTRFNHFTVMQASGYMGVMKFGENCKNTWIAIAKGVVINNVAFLLGITPLGEGVYSDGDKPLGYRVEAGDVFWVDDEYPKKELEDLYGAGCTANAKVVDVSGGNKYVTITLERNQEQVKQ
jgi:hypothetical protein